MIGDLVAASADVLHSSMKNATEVVRSAAVTQMVLEEDVRMVSLCPDYLYHHTSHATWSSAALL